MPIPYHDSELIPEAAIRVLVVDDHPVVRQGVINMLRSQEDISVIGEA